MYIQTKQMSLPISRIRIKAQPQASYRERYYSELDPRRNRAHRFIRTDPNSNCLDHPTIEIPNQWNKKPNLYIRVTLVTVLNEQIPVICVHPYPIDAQELNVIKDVERNTLYFPISDEEFKIGQKSFRIIRNKLTQYQLRNYGRLRLLNKDEKDIQRLNDPTEARKLIELYQLGKSQLVFSFAQLIYENQFPVIYDATSVYSNTMTAVTQTTINDDDLSIRYVPKRGSWHGGDEIIMVIPKLDKRKTCRVIFEHSSMKNIDEIQVDLVDTKTISFKTPPCLIQTIGNQRIQIPIIVIQGIEEIARVNYLYQSCDKCLSCSANLMFDSFDESNVYEQSAAMDGYFDDINDQDIKIENDLSGR